MCVDVGVQVGDDVMLELRVAVPLELSDPVALLLTLFVKDAVFVFVRLNDAVWLSVNDAVSAGDSEVDSVTLGDMLLLCDIDRVILEHDALRLWLLLVVYVVVWLISGVHVIEKVGVEQDIDRVAV